MGCYCCDSLWEQCFWRSLCSSYRSTGTNWFRGNRTTTAMIKRRTGSGDNSFRSLRAIRCSFACLLWGWDSARSWTRAFWPWMRPRKYSRRSALRRSRNDIATRRSGTGRRAEANSAYSQPRQYSLIADWENYIQHEWVFQLCTFFL